MQRCIFQHCLKFSLLLLVSSGSRKVFNASSDQNAIATVKSVALNHENLTAGFLLKNRNVIANITNRNAVSNMLPFLLYFKVPRSESRHIDSTEKDALIILALSMANRWKQSKTVRIVKPAIAVR